MKDRCIIFGPPVRDAYAGFYDWDDKKRPDISRIATQLDRTILEFETHKGYHYIALDPTGLDGKLKFYQSFRSLQEESDYILMKESVLRLTSKHGSVPEFRAAYNIKPEHGSSWHIETLRALHRVEDKMLDMIYPASLRVKTSGKLSPYMSDPNGVFKGILHNA